MMAENTVALSATPAIPQRRPVVLENGAIGMLLFVVCEAMMFAGLISAFNIARAGAGGVWPPVGQPRLPLEETAINTIALLISGVLIAAAAHWFKKAESLPDPKVNRALLVGILLGVFFVGFQGVEWVALVREGLTLTSSQHGSFFYLIVGFHGVHAVGAIVFLAVCWGNALRGKLGKSGFSAACVLWYFVVGVWPFLYLTLYL
jgi:cytochrome c oxidase subunit 3